MTAMYGVRIDVSKRFWHPMPSSTGCQDRWLHCVSVSSGDTVGIVTRPHDSVKIKGVTGTVSPLVVVEVIRFYRSYPCFR